MTMDTLATTVRALAEAAGISPNRAELQMAVLDLSRGGPGQSESAGHLGLAARRHRAQFFGYLLVDENRDQIPHMKMAPLSDMERRVIRRGHAAILYMNEKCLDAMGEVDRGLWPYLDPYARFKPLATAVSPAPTLFDAALADSVAVALRHSAAGRVIAGTPAEIRERVPIADLGGITRRLQDEIRSAGPLEAPSELMPIRLKARGSLGERLATNYWLALTALTEMLGSMDQFVFQIVVKGPIPCVRDGIVLDLEGPIGHGVGTGCVLEYVPDRAELISTIDSGDILHVQSQYCEVDADAVIEGIHIEGTQMGTRVAMTLRHLDDDLNPYHGIVR